MNDDTIDLVGLDRAEVLACLYNASKPQGMGFMQYGVKPMTREEAQRLFDAGQTDFDYLNGRVMKLNFGKIGEAEDLDVRLYDRDNGQGAAARAVSELLLNREINSERTRKIHKANTQASARDLKSRLHQGSHSSPGALYLGVDNPDELNANIDRTLKDLNDSD